MANKLEKALDSYLSSLSTFSLERLVEEKGESPAFDLTAGTVAGLVVLFRRIVRREEMVESVDGRVESILDCHEIAHIDVCIEGLVRLARVMNKMGNSLPVYDVQDEEE
jgi:hypothetical protein